MFQDFRPTNEVLCPWTIHEIPPKKNEGCTVIKQRAESARIALASYHNVPLSQWLPARPESARPFAIPRSRPVSRTSCPASFSEGGFNLKGGGL
eukprot:595514-Pyramimonas_sp.AAC.1